MGGCQLFLVLFQSSWLLSAKDLRLEHATVTAQYNIATQYGLGTALQKVKEKYTCTLRLTPACT